MKERGIFYADNKEPLKLYLGAACPKDKCYIALRNVYVLRICILPGGAGQKPGCQEKQQQQLRKVFFSLAVRRSSFNKSIDYLFFNLHCSNSHNIYASASYKVCYWLPQDTFLRMILNLPSARSHEKIPQCGI